MKILTRFLFCFMISFSLVEFPIMKAQAHAGMITTNEAITEMTHVEGVTTVNNFMARQDVKEQLLKLGVDPQEATKRLASLSEKEVNKLAHDIQKAQVGGDVGGILIIVLVVILIIYFAKRI